MGLSDAYTRVATCNTHLHDSLRPLGSDLLGRCMTVVNTCVPMRLLERFEVMDLASIGFIVAPSRVRRDKFVILCSSAVVCRLVHGLVGC